MEVTCAHSLTASTGWNDCFHVAEEGSSGRGDGWARCQMGHTAMQEVAPVVVRTRLLFQRKRGLEKGPAELRKDGIGGGPTGPRRAALPGHDRPTLTSKMKKTTSWQGLDVYKTSGSSL